MHNPPPLPPPQPTVKDLRLQESFRLLVKTEMKVSSLSLSLSVAKVCSVSEYEEKRDEVVEYTSAVALCRGSIV